MKKWMYDCVLETPATAEAMFKNKEALVGKLVDLFLAKDYKKIVMVASGSSYNIANCSKYAIQTYLGVKVDLINSVTYAKYDYQFHENALVICMSQSGKSTNTIEAVIKAKECGNDVAAISMVPKWFSMRIISLHTPFHVRLRRLPDIAKAGRLSVSRTGSSSRCRNRYRMRSG